MTDFTLSPEDLVRIDAQRLEGLTWREIAAAFPGKPDHGLLRKRVAYRGVTSGRPHGNPADIDRATEIYRLIDAGKTYREIAFLLGCSRGTISGYIHRARIRNGEATKQPRIRIAGPRKPPKPRVRVYVPKPAKVQLVARPTLPPIKFLDRRFGMECAYIEGEAKTIDAECCGAPVEPGPRELHYCPFHALLTTQARAA